MSTCAGLCLLLLVLYEYGLVDRGDEDGVDGQVGIYVQVHICMSWFVGRSRELFYSFT